MKGNFKLKDEGKTISNLDSKLVNTPSISIQTLNQLNQLAFSIGDFISSVVHLGGCGEGTVWVSIHYDI